MNHPSSPSGSKSTASPVRIGLFGIGLDAYWPQFPGLKERLEGYVARVASKLARDGVEIINLGLVDNPDRAFEAGREFRRADVDLIFLHVTTYALSSTVLPVVRRAKVPVIANVFKRAGIPFHQITGVLDHDLRCWNEVDAWVDAARVPDCQAEDLEEAARTAVALDRLAADYRLGSLAYFHKGTGVAENEAVINSIFSAPRN